MNLLTLNFKDKALEQRYLQYQHSIEYKQYRNKFIIFMPPLILSSVWNFSFGFFQSGIGQIGLIILLTIALLFGKRNRILYFEIFLSLAQIECAFLAIVFFHTIPVNSHSGQIQFVLGIALANFQISFLSGINFLLKTFTMLSVMIVVVLYNIDILSLLQPSVQVYFLLITLLVQSTYLREKEKRSKYLTQMQVVQWNLILNNSFGVNVVKYKFDKEKNKLQLLYANKVAQQQDITNTPKLVKFLRTTYLKTQNNRLRRRTISMLSSLYSSHNNQDMERISYAIFKTPKFCQKFFNFNTEAPRSIDGYRKQENSQEDTLNFKVVRYHEEVPCLMLIFKPDLIQQSTLIEMELKQKNLILTDFMRMVKYNCTNFLSFMDQSRSDKQFPRFYINQIHNTQINMSILLNEIDLHFYQPLKTFYIGNIICRLKNAFSPYCKRYHIKLQFKMIGFTDDLSMVSIEWAVYQCLYNLLINAIQNSRKGNFVRLSLMQSKENFENNVIIVQVTNEGSDLLHKKIMLLPLIRPKTIEQLTQNCKFNKVYHNQSNYKSQLGLAVCIQILTIIGYKKTIKINQDNSQTHICIKLCQNISDCRKIRGHKFVDTIKVSDYVRVSKSFEVSNTKGKIQ